MASVTQSVVTINNGSVSFMWTTNPTSPGLTVTLAYWPTSGTTGSTVTNTYPPNSQQAQINVTAGTYGFDIFLGGGTGQHQTGSFTTSGPTAQTSQVTAIGVSGVAGNVKGSITLGSGSANTILITGTGMSWTFNASPSSSNGFTLTLPSVGTYNLTATPRSTTYGSASGYTFTAYYPAPITSATSSNGTLAWSFGSGPYDYAVVSINGATGMKVASGITSIALPSGATTVSVAAGISTFLGVGITTTVTGGSATTPIVDFAGSVGGSTIQLTWGYSGATVTSASLSWTGAMVGVTNVGGSTSFSMLAVPGSYLFSLQPKGVVGATLNVLFDSGTTGTSGSTGSSGATGTNVDTRSLFQKYKWWFIVGGALLLILLFVVVISVAGKHHSTPTSQT